jgi:hypothetical protein
MPKLRQISSNNFQIIFLSACQNCIESVRIIFGIFLVYEKIRSIYWSDLILVAVQFPKSLPMLIPRMEGNTNYQPKYSLRICAVDDKTILS